MKKLKWTILAALLMVAGSARADQFVGAMKLPVQFTGNISSLVDLAENVSLRFRNYQSYLPAGHGLWGRVCMTWTDGGVSDNWVSIQISARISGNRFTNVLGGTFPTTWSGEGLYHTECAGTWEPYDADWQPISNLDICGSGWANSCVIQASTSGNFGVVIKDMWLELAMR